MELLMPIEQGRPFDTWDLSTIKEELFSRRAIHNMHLDQVSKSSLEKNELSRIAHWIQFLKVLLFLHVHLIMNHKSEILHLLISRKYV